MKNQKITRTITIANIDVVTFNSEEMLVEKKRVVIPTMHKLTDKTLKNM